MNYQYADIRLEIQCQGSSLLRVRFVDSTEPMEPTQPQDDFQRRIVTELDEYFAGKRKHFEIAYSLKGTEFQISVWKCLEEIAWGERISYRELACRIGKPMAVRAVGNTLGANPIPIILPCHRVLASGGGLGGFAGGLEIKRFLLELETER